MINGDLVVNGVEVKNTVIEHMSRTEAMSWEAQVYIELDKKLGPNQINFLSEAFGEEFDRRWKEHMKVCALEIKKEELQSKINQGLEVDGIHLKIIKIFPVYHSGWESDNEGFIVESCGVRKVVLTRHGEPYFAQINEIEGFIADYTQALLDMKEAIKTF